MGVLLVLGSVERKGDGREEPFLDWELDGNWILEEEEETYLAGWRRQKMGDLGKRR